MFNVFDLQKKLVEAALPSGSEQKVGALLAELARPFVDEVWTDALGSVICHKKGPGKRIMMPAHMDTIGFIALYIEEEGFIRFDGIGGHTPANLTGTPIRFASGVRGTIRPAKLAELAAKPYNAIKMSDLYIDIGAKDKAEAEKLVRVGDVAVFDTVTQLVAGNNLMTPYADDLIACVVLLLTMERLKDQKCENDLYFVFSVQEEVGLRGATTAAFAIDPYMGIAVDVCSTGDTPTSVDKMVVKVGAGPTVKIKDGSLICNPQVVQHLRAAADAAGIAYQDEILVAGGTDSGAMQRTRGGVYSGCISIPTRHIHSPAEICNIGDVEQASVLLAAACTREVK
ncbi:MAG: M42 family peptidase [Clostridia bacterium]|nr:M42 family peptidase [Clostridia bacterium]